MSEMWQDLRYLLMHYLYFLPFHRHYKPRSSPDKSS